MYVLPVFPVQCRQFCWIKSINLTPTSSSTQAAVAPIQTPSNSSGLNKATNEEPRRATSEERCQVPVPDAGSLDRASTNNHCRQPERKPFTFEKKPAPSTLPRQPGHTTGNRSAGSRQEYLIFCLPERRD
jgi:hypothetical protein